MKKIYISLLLVFSCASPSSSATHYKHLYYPSNNINVYKIETTEVEYKLLPPPVVKDDSINTKYFEPKPPKRKVHNFALRRF